MTTREGALSSYDQRFAKVEREIQKVHAGQILLKWVVGFGIALDVVILIRVFF